MTTEGYKNRLFSVEWHAELYRRKGTPRELCERMMRHCTECIEADYYSEPRPKTDDEWSRFMEAYFDRLWPLAGPVSFD